MADEPLYVYGVYDSFWGLRLERVLVLKKTPMTLTLGERASSYGGNKRIDIGSAFWTPQDAVDAWIKKMQGELESNKRHIKVLESNIAELPHMLKAFELELEAAKAKAQEAP